MSQPATLLETVLTSLLAPLFLTATGDLSLARIAAAEAIAAYRAENPAELIAAGQVIAFSLAAIAAATSSMGADIPPALIVRLNASAAALSRAAAQTRRALQQKPPETQPEPASPVEDPFLSPTAAHFLAQEAQSRLENAAERTPQQRRQHDKMMGIAMVSEASELEASLPNLSPSERYRAEQRAGTLRGTANGLLTGHPNTSLSSNGSVHTG